MEATMENPIVYKFTSSKYQDTFLSGKSVRVGTLTAFRGMDDPTSRYWKAIEPPASQERENALLHLGPTGGIDDALEGRTVLHVDRFKSASEVDQARARITQKTTGYNPFDGISGPGVGVSDMIVVHAVPNCFIFCCSNDLSEETIERMTQDSEVFGGKPYDIAIPILDMNGFLNAMTIAVCRKMKMFGEIHNRGGCVEYSKTVFQLGNHAAVQPSPFRKHSVFATQNEFRFIIARATPENQEAILVDLNCDTSSMFGTPITL